MSRYSALVADFFLNYEKPQVDPLTVGFSAIDPPKKIDSSKIDHELIAGLLGGNEDGHYHLTKDQWDDVIEMVDMHVYDGGFAGTTEDEYQLNIDHWLDGGESSW